MEAKAKGHEGARGTNTRVESTDTAERNAGVTAKEKRKEKEKERQWESQPGASNRQRKSEWHEYSEQDWQEDSDEVRGTLVGVCEVGTEGHFNKATTDSGASV